MTNKSTKKTKKPLQTTLGRATTSNGEKIDLSHVRKPIQTSIFGLSQVLSLSQTGTQEVLRYIDNECDLIYECRVCRSLFRSIANFILHKREYCAEKFSAVLKYPENLVQNSTILKVPDENTNDSDKQQNKADKKSSTNQGNTLSSVINKLKERHEIKEFSKAIINQDLSGVKDDSPKLTSDNNLHDLVVEEIANNKEAVFQTLVANALDNGGETEHMKSQVLEVHTILGKNEAVLGPDGKLFALQPTDKSASTCRTNLICPECNMKFSTKKTLSYHINYKHNKTRRVFICPDCKGHFANAWGVYRHLYRVHRRTAGYIKRMRDQINNSVISKEALPVKKKEKTDGNKIDATDEENQWLNNIEGDKDFQMCGGCGKRFERKAALHSHAQMCIKRIAVCNSIKENSAKRKEEEVKDKNKPIKFDKVCSSELPDIPKGASKRKPYLLRTYKKPGDNIVNKEEEVLDNCDVNANSKVDVNCDIISKVVPENLLAKNDETHFNNKEYNSPNAKLNSSDNFENFRGFSREWKTLDELLCSFKKTDNSKSNSHESNTSDVNGHIQNEISHSSPIRKQKDGLSDFSVLLTKTSGKISCRSLEDLTGVSPIKNKQKGEVTNSTVPVERKNKDENKSSLKTSPRKSNPSKRKRSSSHETSPVLKNQRVHRHEILTKDRNINFIDKASPYMDKDKLECKPCKKTYSNFSKLLWHMSGHFSWFRFQCSRCSFISFTKSDCSKHAYATHGTDQKDLQSVVLPIPNWKIVLMSHDFSEFNEDNDLTGKHTDEVIIDCDEESKEVEEKKPESDEMDKNADILGTLFVDTEGFEDCIEGTSAFPFPIVHDTIQIKNEITDVDHPRFDEVIDIVDDTNDSFLIDEVPQEMYSVEAFELNSEVIEDIENTQFSVISSGTDEDLFEKYFVPRSKDIEFVIMDNIKSEAQESLNVEHISPCCSSVVDNIKKEPDMETDAKVNGIDVHNINDNESVESGSPDKIDFITSTNTRPTRNRTRSIKTRHVDFFYELNKSSLPTEAQTNKAISTQKLKKKPTLVCSKTKFLIPKIS